MVKGWNLSPNNQKKKTQMPAITTSIQCYKELLASAIRQEKEIKYIRKKLIVSAKDMDHKRIYRKSDEFTKKILSNSLSLERSKYKNQL